MAGGGGAWPGSKQYWMSCQRHILQRCLTLVSALLPPPLVDSLKVNSLLEVVREQAAFSLTPGQAEGRVQVSTAGSTPPHPSTRLCTSQSARGRPLIKARGNDGTQYSFPELTGTHSCLGTWALPGLEVAEKEDFGLYLESG